MNRRELLKAAAGGAVALTGVGAALPAVADVAEVAEDALYWFRMETSLPDGSWVLSWSRFLTPEQLMRQLNITVAELRRRVEAAGLSMEQYLNDGDGDEE